MNYFSNCKTIEEAEKIKKDLCKELHPDKGGKTEDFQEMMNQFREFKSSILNSHFNNSSYFRGIYKNIKIMINENDEIEFLIPGIIKGQLKLLNDKDSFTSQIDLIIDIVKKIDINSVKSFIKGVELSINMDDEIEFFVSKLVKGQCKIISEIGPKINQLISYYLFLKTITK